MRQWWDNRDGDLSNVWLQRRWDMLFEAERILRRERRRAWRPRLRAWFGRRWWG